VRLVKLYEGDSGSLHLAHGHRRLRAILTCGHSKRSLGSRYLGIGEKGDAAMGA